MKKYLLWLVFLSGCASTGDLLKKNPAAEFDSKKSPSDLASCVSSNWIRDYSEYKMSANDLQEGKSISLTSKGLLLAPENTVATALISKNEMGSHLKLFQYMDSASGWGKSIESCR